MAIIHIRQKYSSLLISLAGHLLLLVALYALRMHNQHIEPMQAPAPQQKAAKVSFHSPSPERPHTQAPSPTVPVTAPHKSPAPIPPSDQRKGQTPQQIKSITPVPSTSTATDSPQHAGIGPQKAIKPEPRSVQASESSQRAPAHPTDQRKSLSGAAFMNAFRRSVQTEQLAIRPSATQSTEYGHAPQHVQERAKEWQQASYLERIRRAIVAAARRHKKYVRVPAALKTRLYFTLTVDSHGVLKDIPKREASGMDDIDDYISDFFKNIDFPPIPARFKLKEFPVKLTIQLTLAEGGHHLQLTPLYED